METIRMLTRGKLMEFSQSALQVLTTGERLAFLEIFSGEGLLTVGVRAHGLKAADGWDRERPFGDEGRTWNFARKDHQSEAHQLLDYLDPVIVHLAVPCEKLSTMGLQPSNPNFDLAAFDQAVRVVEFSVDVVRRRAGKGGGGSLENPKQSRLWQQATVVAFFGTREEPRPGRYFASPQLCAYKMREPGSDVRYYQKAVTLAATYHEITAINDQCPGIAEGVHEHERIRGQVKVPGKGWVGRGKLSAVYPLELGLKWGAQVAGAAARLATNGAKRWAARELSLKHI